MEFEDSKDCFVIVKSKASRKIKDSLLDLHIPPLIRSLLRIKLEFLVKYMILFLYTQPQNSQLIFFSIRFRVQFYPKKKFLSLYSNMAAPNMNGRLHLTGVHQHSPASFSPNLFISTWTLNIYTNQFNAMKWIESQPSIYSMCLLSVPTREQTTNTCLLALIGTALVRQKRILATVRYEKPYNESAGLV